MADRRLAGVARLPRLGLEETPSEHSTISRTRRLIDLETHRAVFTWILQVLAAADLVKGKTIGIDATTLEANEALEAVAAATEGQTAVIDEVVADKGYHSNQVLVHLAALDLRTYIAEPDRGPRRWRGKVAARDAVYANRRRIHGARGRGLQRARSEGLERPNAHLYETGGMRRTHLRGHANILKRLFVHIGGFNLGLLMRTLFWRRDAAWSPGRAGGNARDARRLQRPCPGSLACRRLGRRRSSAAPRVASSCRTSDSQRVGNAFRHGLLAPTARDYQGFSSRFARLAAPVLRTSRW